jgi:hypothetical protein
MPEFTAVQRAALSWARLERSEPGRWREINQGKLSFTVPFQDPLTQLYGSVAAGFAQLHLAPGSAAGLGFAATDATDAIRLQAAWMDLLAAAPSWKEPS